MGPKVKSLFKGFKYITQIFVYKEQEMVIGNPTDVRHVAHVGFDSDSTNAPSWMRYYKSASDVTPASINGLTSVHSDDLGHSLETSWSSQDFNNKQGRRWQSISSCGNCMDSSRCDQIPTPSKKKKKRKKVKASSPVMSSSSSRTSFATALEEPNETSNRLPIASYEEQATRPSLIC
ncbi:hypothetical protein HPP92_009890 [Vanilla planifolia]|uniref:CRIB domain-containing protein n=1 Tax=Vanilla planifolia TaxID=51239 RepID=A0A835QXX7_VANPL|nr:hypothetical protein HPP92_009890 [Vanilla planifolia]